MDSESSLPAAVEDLEMLRRVRPVYRARKVMGLLLPGETLADFYRYMREWERERKSLHENQDQGRGKLPVCHPKSVPKQGLNQDCLQDREEGV